MSNVLSCKFIRKKSKFIDKTVKLWKKIKTLQEKEKKNFKNKIHIQSKVKHLWEKGQTWLD